MLEQSTFNNCSAIAECGSLTFDCQQGGQFVQERTCYFSSVARADQAFGQAVTHSASYKNYALEVSVSKCGESETKMEYTFGIGMGDLIISSINSTNNICSRYSSIGCSLDGNSGICNFSTFRGNNQSESYSLEFYINSNEGTNDDILTHTVSYCNIIENKCRTDDNQVLFYCKFTTNVDHCIFLNNTAKYMFYEYSKGYTLTISNSYVDDKSIREVEDEFEGGSVSFTNEKENYDLAYISNFNGEDCYVNPKDITDKIPYLFKFAKCASPQLLSSKY